MQEKEREEDVLEVPQETKTNRKLIIFVIIGIIIVVLAILAILGYAYFVGNNIPPVNLTGNETGINTTGNNLPVPNATGINGTTPATNRTTNRTTPPGGGGGGGDDEDSGCTPNKDCSYYYNLNQCGSSLDDGCANSLNCIDCITGKTCINQSCVQLFYCTNDANCTSLNGACGRGLCNLTIGSCYVNFSEERSLCPGGLCHLGICVRCINNDDCGVNESCIDGACFSENEAFSFMFIGDDNQDSAERAIQFAYTNHTDLEIIFSIPDNGWQSRNNTYWRYAKQLLKNPNRNGNYIPLFMGLGNHDAEVMDSVNYSVEVLGPKLSSSLPGLRNFREGPYDVYPNGYEDRNLTYSFDYKNAHFIMLNGYFHDLLLDPPRNRFDTGYSPRSCISLNMLDWLEYDLSQTNATFKFMFYHEGAHPVPGGRHTGDSFDDSGCPGNYNSTTGTRPMRDRFWSLLAKYNVTANFVGHAHHNTATWANDLYGENGAVYEIESGVPPALAVVNIKGDDASLKLYNVYYDGIKYNQFLPFGNILLSGDSVNHPPKIYHHYAGIEDGFYVLSKRNYIWEVDTGITGAYGTLDGAGSLYFEAKDSDIEDKLIFSFNNLPSFLVINDTENGVFRDSDWSNQYRRIALSIPDKLTNASIGNYSFDVKVSDGESEDKMNINISVLPAEKPVVLGATIENNSFINFPMHLNDIYFVCQDNIGAGVSRYNSYKVKFNGASVGCCSLWHSYSGFKVTDKLAFSWFFFQDLSWDETDDTVPGKYEITATCGDGAGHESEKYTITVNVYNDSSGMPISHIYGSWPANNSNVNELLRISFWADSTIANLAIPALKNLIEVKRDGNIFNDYDLVSGRYNGSLSFGSFDIIFNSPAGNGIYEVNINKSTFNFIVGGFGAAGLPEGAYEYNGSSLPSESASLSIFSQIYNSFKGFLTANTIKEITGYFLRIKA